MPVHGGKLAARALKHAGVECIFTLSGGHIMPLYDGCIDEGIRIVDVRHEQAAVHAADAWARCNPGKIGVAAITAGPGVTDGVTGVANAWRANSPDPRDRRPGPLREPAPRLAPGDGPRRRDAADHQVRRRRATRPTASPSTSSSRIRHAVSGIPGPAFLEIPMDVFMGQVRVRARRCSRRSAPSRRASRPIATTCATRSSCCAARQAPDADGRAPASSGRARAAAMNALHRGDAHARPTRTAWAAARSRRTRPQFLNRSRREALKKIDCVVLAGTLLDFRMRFGKTIPADAKIIQLDMDATLIGQNRARRRRRWSATSPARFELLLEEMKNAGRAARLLRLARRAARDRGRGREEGRGGARQRRGRRSTRSACAARSRDWLATLGDTIVIGDGGDIVATAAKILPVQREGAWMDPGPLGTLGVGMPFALAAQLAHPEASAS